MYRFVPSPQMALGCIGERVDRVDTRSCVPSPTVGTAMVSVSERVPFAGVVTWIALDPSAVVGSRANVATSVESLTTYTLVTMTPDPSTLTEIDPPANPDPVIVTLRGPPGVKVAGLTDIAAGAGASTRKVCGSDWPPGVATRTFRTPGAAVGSIMNVTSALLWSTKEK